MAFFFGGRFVYMSGDDMQSLDKVTAALNQAEQSIQNITDVVNGAAQLASSIDNLLQEAAQIAAKAG